MSDDKVPTTNIQSRNHRKHQHEFEDCNTDVSKPKKPKITEATQTAEDKDDDDAVRTHYTDLNPDCWDHILSYLEPIDLMHVFDLNANTKSAAKFTYQRHYSNFPVAIRVNDQSKGIRIKNSSIRIDSAALCLRYLTAFGGSIKKLSLYYRLGYGKIIPKQWFDVVSSIGAECGKTLLDLELFYCSVTIMNHFDDVFEKLNDYTSIVAICTI